MNIGLAVWQQRISPVFDASRSLRIVRISDDGIEISREDVALAADSLAARVAQLRDRSIQTLICGAVSAPLAAMIETAGIQLIPFVAGPEDAVLAAYMNGTLPSEEFALPGCCGQQQHMRNRRGHCGCGRGRNVR